MMEKIYIAAYMHNSYRSLITTTDFIELTKRPEVKMSRFQRCAIWFCYATQKDKNQASTRKKITDDEVRDPRIPEGYPVGF